MDTAKLHDFYRSLDLAMRVAFADSAGLKVSAVEHAINGRGLTLPTAELLAASSDGFLEVDDFPLSAEGTRALQLKRTVARRMWQKLGWARGMSRAEAREMVAERMATMAQARAAKVRSASSQGPSTAGARKASPGAPAAGKAKESSHA